MITRLRLADDETMAIEWLHAPRRLLGDLRREELADHSYYELLRERRGITIASGVQTIEPTVTSPEEAELLGVPVHSPAFLFERTTQSDAGEVVEFVRSVYRGDRYRLVTELRPALPVSAGRRRCVVVSLAANGRRVNHSTPGGEEDGMRKFSVAAAALVLAAVVAACGGGGDDDKRPPAGVRTGKLEGSISVWIMDPGSPKIQGVVKQYGTDFEAAHPGTKIDIQFVPWAQAHDKFVTAIAGGKVPDVAEMGTTWTPEFAEQGGLLEQPKIAKDEYVSSLVDAATLDGKVYGKPWYAGARSLIYRKDILEKAGVAAAQDLGRDDGRGQGDQGQGQGRLPGRLHRALRAHVPADDLAGGRGDRDPGRGDLEERAEHAEAAKAIDYYTSFYKEGMVPKAAVGWEEPDAQTAFINGDVAMLIAGGWTYNSIIATKPELEEKIGTELTPTGPSGKGTAFAGGSHLVQFPESKNQELGAAFVDFMLQPDQLNKFTREIGFLPGTTDGIKASGYLEDAVRKPFAEQLLEPRAVYPPSPKWGGLEGANIFDGEIQKVMKGEATAQEAVAELAKKMDEEFAG